MARLASEREAGACAVILNSLHLIVLPLATVLIYKLACWLDSRADRAG